MSKLPGVCRIPPTAHTLTLITVSLNIRLSFTLFSRLSPTFAIAKISGRRLLPYGCTQLYLKKFHDKYHIYLVLNDRAKELINIKKLNMSNFHPNNYILYITSYNYFINRPLSLKHICLPILYMVLPKQTLPPSELPKTLRNELLFPKRRSLRYRNTYGYESLHIINF